jgi:hypothetical protein
MNNGALFLIVGCSFFRCKNEIFLDVLFEVNTCMCRQKKKKIKSALLPEIEEYS